MNTQKELLLKKKNITLKELPVINSRKLEIKSFSQSISLNTSTTRYPNDRAGSDFDETIGEINIIPQDIGKLFLNLFTNAFYAVKPQKNKNLISYEPAI